MVFRGYRKKTRHIFDRYAKKKDKKRRDPRKERDSKLMSIFEHQQMYQQHLQRIRQATSVVDSKAPFRRNRDSLPPREKSFTELLNMLRHTLQSNNSPLTFTKWPSAIPTSARSVIRLSASGAETARERGSSSWLNARPETTRETPHRLGRVFRMSEHSLSPGDKPKESRSQSLVPAHMQNAPPLRQINSWQPYGRIEPHKAPKALGPISPQNWPARKRVERKNTPSSARYSAYMTVSEKKIESPPAAKEAESPDIASLEELVRKHDIPMAVLQRFQKLTVTKNMCLLRKLLRPRIFIDLELAGLRPLGRLVIQLFTEACPEVVLEFVRICTSHACERFHFTRLFPPLWMEGEVALTDNKTLTARNIEHDTSVLNHGYGPGILSFPSRYVRGSKRRFLSFSVSFKPLDVLNGKRVAFGNVQRGHWILDAIQDYGSNNGKPTREIVVTKCGLL